MRANLGECAEAILTVVDSFQDVQDMDAGDMEEVEKILTSLVKRKKFQDFVAAVQSGDVAEGRASGTTTCAWCAHELPSVKESSRAPSMMIRL